MPTVWYRTSDTKVEFDEGDEVNLLRAAIRNECGLPYKCASGNCGTDRVLIESGTEHLSRVRPKERDRLGDGVDRGYRLACQTYASGDVTLSWDPGQTAIPNERLRDLWLAGNVASERERVAEREAERTEQAEAAPADEGPAEATWTDVAALTEVERRKRLLVNRDGHEIVLFLLDGRVRALDNICIHKQRQLFKGTILGNRVVCPGHQWAFDLDTGFEQKMCEYQPSYEVRVEDGRVLVADQPRPVS